MQRMPNEIHRTDCSPSEKAEKRTRKLVSKETQKEAVKINKENDGIAYHHQYTANSIDFRNTTILAEQKAYLPRLIKEGIQNKKLKPTE